MTSATRGTKYALSQELRQLCSECPPAHLPRCAMCLGHGIHPHSNQVESRPSQARQPPMHDLPHRYRLYSGLHSQY